MGCATSHSEKPLCLATSNDHLRVGGSCKGVTCCWHKFPCVDWSASRWVSQVVLWPCKRQSIPWSYLWLFFLHWNLSSGHAWWKLPSWLLTYLMCTIPDIANTLHSLEHAIRPWLLPTVTAINRKMFALFLHFTIPNTHTDEPQTFYPSSPQHSNFNPSRTLNSRTNYMETTNPTTIQQIQKGWSRLRRGGDTYP